MTPKGRGVTIPGWKDRLESWDDLFVLCDRPEAKKSKVDPEVSEAVWHGHKIFRTNWHIR